MATKLVVEVVEARNLLPKDGVGTSSPYVVIDFDGQRRRTTTLPRQLNPSWNEVLEFEATAGGADAGEVLEVNVYHDRRVGSSRRSNFLGRLKLDSRQFVRKGEEALQFFPLQRKSLLSWVTGDLGLKIYYQNGGDVPLEGSVGGSNVNPEVVAVAELPVGEEEPTDGVAENEKVLIPSKEEEEPPPETPVTSPLQENAPPKTEPETATPPTIPPPSPLPDDQEAQSQPPHGSAAEEHHQQPLRPPPPDDQEAQPQPPSAAEEHGQLQPRRLPVPPLMLDPPPERSSFDLVDKMQYLFIRVVGARSLPRNSNPDVTISFNGHRVTLPTSSLQGGERIFAFHLPNTSIAAALDVTMWDTNAPQDSLNDGRRFLGGVSFDTSEIPVRDPPDSPLAAQWCRLVGGKGCRGELMLVTWVGTQADESFHEAAKVGDDTPGEINVTSKVYLSPKLWYLRVSVIEAQDLPATPTVVSVKVTSGFQTLRTRSSASTNGSISWNEDLIFVVADPLADKNLVLDLEISTGKERAQLGTATIQLPSIERRVDDRHVASRWIAIEPPERKPESKCSMVARLHVRACLDGGYHVADELPHATSDYRPSARQLWKRPIGTVELGIVGCSGLVPTRIVGGRGTTDAYAVAKYGPKWARTRTLPGTLDPAWNEQYSWDVHDVCTVITVVVFDDTTSQPMGRVRIRISNLDQRRNSRSVHPLLLPFPGGVKRTGELELAIRFTRTAPSLEFLSLYLRPVEPAMHHIRPIPTAEAESLRFATARLVAAHLASADPPLRREVVVHVLEAAAPPRFSFRKVRTNWKRLAACLTWVDDVASWARGIVAWRNPVGTTLVHVVLVLLLWFPEVVVPAVAVHLVVAGVCRYRKRPSGMGMVVSESGTVEEMDEEMDGVPTTKGYDAVRVRYDRLRAVGIRFQEMVGEAATQAERAAALLTWRDRRATAMFLIVCLLIATVLLAVPARTVVVGLGFYHLRHPAFKDRSSPPAVVSFFRRLPSLAERYV